MRKVTDWKARRCGAAITVTGKDDEDNDRGVTLTNVSEIAVRDGKVIATVPATRDTEQRPIGEDVEYELAV